MRPYLHDKKDKTFVDRWLLGELTPEDLHLDRLQRRNALELALLVQRGGPADVIGSMLRETWELRPPDPEGHARRVRAALMAGELEEAGGPARAAEARVAEHFGAFGAKPPAELRRAVPGVPLAERAQPEKQPRPSAALEAGRDRRADAQREVTLGLVEGAADAGAGGVSAFEL